MEQNGISTVLIAAIVSGALVASLLVGFFAGYIARTFYEASSGFDIALPQQKWLNAAWQKSKVKSQKLKVTHSSERRLFNYLPAGHLFGASLHL